jgi:hypothetical protein
MGQNTTLNGCSIRWGGKFYICCKTMRGSPFRRSGAGGVNCACRRGTSGGAWRRRHYHRVSCGVNPAALGLPLTAYLHVTAQTGRCDPIQAFAIQQPTVTECYCIAGERDILIKGTFESVAQLQQLVNELLRYGNVSTSWCWTPTCPGARIPDTTNGRPVEIARYTLRLRLQAAYNPPMRLRIARSSSARPAPTAVVTNGSSRDRRGRPPAG